MAIIIITLTIRFATKYIADKNLKKISDLSID